MIALGGSQAAIDGWVNGELEEHANDTQDCCCETNTLRQHPKTTGEDEGQLLRQTSRVVGVETGGRQEKKPKVVESTHLEVEKRLSKQGAQDILSPDPLERQDAGLPRRSSLFFHLVAFRAVEGSVQQRAFFVIITEGNPRVQRGGRWDDGFDTARENTQGKSAQSWFSFARIECLVMLAWFVSSLRNDKFLTSSNEVYTKIAHAARKKALANIGNA